MSEIPDWIPVDAWAGYVEMRARSPKTKMTERAMALRIKDLERFHEAGHDVGAILDQSTANGWTDLYELKDRRTQADRRNNIPQLGKHGQATADNAKDWLNEQSGMPETLEDQRKFAALISGLADYYKSEISKVVLRLYWEGLRQYDYAAIEKACWAHTQNPDTGMFMPKTADIIKMVAGRTDDQAKVAWAKVDRAIRSSPGVYSTVAFDDALIHRVLFDMGGWASLGSKSEDEWPFVAREFETRYRGYRMRSDKPDYPPLMIGICAKQNSADSNVCREDIFLIGNRSAAIAVLQGGSENIIPQVTMAMPSELIPAISDSLTPPINH